MKNTNLIFPQPWMVQKRANAKPWDIRYSGLYIKYKLFKNLDSKIDFRLIIKIKERNDDFLCEIDTLRVIEREGSVETKYEPFILKDIISARKGEFVSQWGGGGLRFNWYRESSHILCVFQSKLTAVCFRDNNCGKNNSYDIIGSKQSLTLHRRQE